MQRVACLSTPYATIPPSIPVYHLLSAGNSRLNGVQRAQELGAGGCAVLLSGSFHFHQSCSAPPLFLHLHRAGSGMHLAWTLTGCKCPPTQTAQTAATAATSATATTAATMTQNRAMGAMSICICPSSSIVHAAVTCTGIALPSTLAVGRQRDRGWWVLRRRP
jgi:hypothetical protein